MFRELPPRGPDGPRPTTPDMVADASHAGRLARIFGVVGACVWIPLAFVFAFALPARGAPVGIFPALAVGCAGIVTYAIGWWLRARQMELFRNGEEARGEVLAVEIDPYQKINGRRPWKVRYRFEADGSLHEGAMKFWTDDPPAELAVGREIVVLHEPGKPARNLLWSAATPPVEKKRKRREGARIREAWQGPYAAEESDEAAEAEAEAEADARPPTERVD